MKHIKHALSTSKSQAKSKETKFEREIGEAVKQLDIIIRTYAVTKHMPDLDKRLTVTLLFEMLSKSYRSTSGAVYCTISEQEIADRLGVCRETISDHIQIIEKTRLITVIRRRQEQGVWQTNLYKIGAILWSLIGAVIRRFVSIFHRVTWKSHIGTKKSLNTIPDEENKVEAITKYRNRKDMTWLTEFFVRKPDLV